jgi:hypothetical protein
VAQVKYVLVRLYLGWQKERERELFVASFLFTISQFANSEFGKSRASALLFRLLSSVSLIPLSVQFNSSELTQTHSDNMIVIVYQNTLALA